MEKATFWFQQNLNLANLEIFRSFEPQTPSYTMADIKRSIDDGDQHVFNIIRTLLRIFLLIFWTYQRKQISFQPVKRIMWLATSMAADLMWLAANMAADFAAIFSLGRFFHVYMSLNASQYSAKEKYLLALWPPFILLHLRSHSKMTAFCLADNKLWLSHILRFVYHEVTAFIICILASTEREFHCLSTILFIIGTVKIFALKWGCMKELRSSTLNEAEVDPSIILANRRGELVFEFDHPIDRASQLVVHSRENDVKTLCAAYQSFNKYKGLYVGAIFLYGDRVDEGMPFADMNIRYAFNMMDMELSFAHDLFYSKTALTCTFWGWIVRIVSLASIIFATGFFVNVNKHGFQQPDVCITYGLIIAALIFEVLGFLESLISNQTIVQVGFLEGQKWRLLEAIIRGPCNFTKLIKGILSPKPNFIGQFDMLRYCYSDSQSSIWFKRLLDFLELKELWDHYRCIMYVSSDDRSHHMRQSRIFNEVRRRLAEERSEGESNSFQTLISPGVSSKMKGTELEAYIQNAFEKWIFIWHFATHFCFEIVDKPPVALKDAKFLSDYMLYLLTVHPSTVSSVATTELTSYRKACAASIQLYTQYWESPNGPGPQVYRQLEELDVITAQENRDGPIFLLLEGYRVADKLMLFDRQQLDMGGNNRWELLFQAWVDVLSYIAHYSEGKCHAEQLGTGGQFLTYVWLFMVHLTLDSHYQI